MPSSSTRVGVRLHVGGVAQARVLLLEPDAVEEALVPLRAEPLGERGRARPRARRTSTPGRISASSPASHSNDPVGRALRAVGAGSPHRERARHAEKQPSIPTVSVSTNTRSPASSRRSVASARHGFVFGPERTPRVTRYSPPPRTITSESTASRSRSRTPGAIAASNAPSMAMHEPPVRSRERDLLGVFTARASITIGPGLDDRVALGGERRVRDRRELVDRDTPAVGDPELAERGARPRAPRPPPQRRVVEELPRVERPQVGLDVGEQVHRVPVLEQHRRARRRHHRAPHERAQAVHGHRRGAGRIPDVRLVREQERGDVMVAHRPLQPLETPQAQPLEIDAVVRDRRDPHDRHAGTRRGGRGRPSVRLRAGADPRRGSPARTQWASRSRPRSPPRRPTSCSPTGSPSSVVPHGTEIAGSPVTVIVQHEAIQSR